jgi:hypothetical protein
MGPTLKASAFALLLVVDQNGYRDLLALGIKCTAGVCHVLPSRDNATVPVPVSLPFVLSLHSIV